MNQAAVMERMQEIMLTQWHELLRLRDEVLINSDVEAIHDLRVVSRRFRAALQLFDPWLPPKATARLKKSTRKLTRVLGGLRNIDEALLFFREHLPANTGNHICRKLSPLRSNERELVTHALTSFDHRDCGRMLKKAAAQMTAKHIAACGNDSLASYFTGISHRRFQPVHKLLPVAMIPAEHASRHALRIAIKKWRYFFEIAAPVTGQDYDAILGQLKEYQTILGRMNDLTEFGALCGRLKLTRRERNCIEDTLRTEEELLLRNLTELIDRTPLTNPLPITSRERRTS